MRKNLGVKSYLYPMPVLIIASYDEAGKADAMNAAWGSVCDSDKVALYLSHKHKTVKNILARKAFTVSMADAAHVTEADYVGIVSGNDTPDKMEKSGLHTVKSDKVDAPMITEFPLTLECRVVEDKMEVYGHHIIGEIVGVLADEAVLDEKGKVDAAKLNAFVFDQFRSGYYAIGEKVGQAWHTGAPLMKK